MAGTVRCARRGCGKRMTGRVCSCGSSICYVDIYWTGQHWYYRRTTDHHLLTYDRGTKLLAAKQNEIDEGRFKPQQEVPAAVRERLFAGKVEEWLDWKRIKLEQGLLSPSYVRRLESYRRHWYTFLDDKDVLDIIEDKQILVKFLYTMRHKAIKTRKNVMNALENFFVWCREENGCTTGMPVFPKIDIDDCEPRKAVVVEVQESALKKIPDDYRDIIEFGMETAFRPGETTALKVKDIDFAMGRALIARTWSDYQLHERPKGRKKRYRPLSDRALEIATIHAQGKHPEAFLFINPRTAGPYKRKRLGEVWNQYTGLPVTHYEGTRHSCLTQLARRGVPLSTLQEVAGHADSRSTEVYIHAALNDARAAVNYRQDNVMQIVSKTKAKRDSESETLVAVRETERRE
jgi:integrase